MRIGPRGPARAGHRRMRHLRGGLSHPHAQVPAHDDHLLEGVRHSEHPTGAGYGGRVFKALLCSIVLFVAIAAIGLWLRRARGR